MHFFYSSCANRDLFIVFEQFIWLSTSTGEHQFEFGDFNGFKFKAACKWCRTMNVCRCGTQKITRENWSERVIGFVKILFIRLGLETGLNGWNSNRLDRSLTQKNSNP